MGQTSKERLTEYLAQLPPQAQALLVREFERAIARGEDTAVATLVLDLLRKVARRTEEGERPSSGDLARLFFRPLDPFITDGSVPTRPGIIRRASLFPIWQWVAREGAPEQAREYEAAMALSPESGAEAEGAVRRLQLAAGEAIMKIAGPGARGDHQRALARIGAPEAVEDLLPVGAVLQAREALDGLASRLPTLMRVFADSWITTVVEALNVPSLQTPLLLPFALSLVMKRLAAPWQIIRLAIRWQPPTTSCAWRQRPLASP
jgi:hypothetical protein